MVAHEQSILLDVEDLSVKVSFKNQNIVILDGISFCLSAGEILGITGYSGSGKSMTALSIMGLLRYLDQITVSGRITFEGNNILEANENDLSLLRGAQMSMVIQQPIDAFDPVRRIGKQLEDAVYVHHPKISKDELQTIILLSLNEVGLVDTQKCLKAYPHELSGGQLQRIAIAMALINKPKLLIADEPTSSLDGKLSAEINELLFQLVRTRNMSMIYISHQISMMEGICHKIIVIDSGKIKGNTSESDQTSFKNDHVVEYLNQKITKSVRAFNQKENFEKFKLVNISKTYITNSFLGFREKKFRVLAGINLAVQAGEMVGILGPSGSGKSTLAKIISGLVAPDSGMLCLNGELYDQSLLESDKTSRRKIQMILQSSFSSLQPKMTIERQWKEVYNLYHQSDATGFESVKHDWLRDTGLPEDVLTKYPSQLSGGQIQRAALVRSLLTKPELIIFDESLSALDVKHQNLMISLITTLQDKLKFGGLFITHDLVLAKAICHQIFMIKDGTLSKMD